MPVTAEVAAGLRQMLGDVLFGDLFTVAPGADRGEGHLD